MAVMCLVLFLALILFSPSYESSEKDIDTKCSTPKPVSRIRRDMPELSSMIEEVTGRSSFCFLNYGRFCGQGGHGQPVDELDTCCAEHDSCFDVADKSVCSQRCSSNLLGIYGIPYKWHVDDNRRVVCEDENDPCQIALCGCDHILATCLKTHLSKYNQKYYDPFFPFLVHRTC